MVLDEQRSIADVARSIGVNEGTLGNWVAKARRERSAGVGLNGDERTELAELRAEVT
jgi:transposase